MNNDLTFGVHGAFDPNITFMGGASKEVMRIDKNGVTINSEIPLDEAAQYVIGALDEHIKSLVQAEREACAKVCDARSDEDGFEGGYADQCAIEIRARGEK